MDHAHSSPFLYVLLVKIYKKFKEFKGQKQT